MKRFLRETWELGYWAMFCPTKLQQRINASIQEQEEKTVDASFWDIIFMRVNRRSRDQYLLLVLFLSLPLAMAIYNYGQPQAWFLLPIVFLIAYFLGYCFFSRGLIVPLLFALVYSQRPETFLEKGNFSFKFLPSISQIFVAVVITILALIILRQLEFWLIKKNHQIWLQNVHLFGGSLIVFLASYLVSRNFFLALGVSGITSLFLFPVKDKTDDTNPWMIYWPFWGTIAWPYTGSLAWVLFGATIGGIIGMFIGPQIMLYFVPVVLTFVVNIFGVVVSPNFWINLLIALLGMVGGIVGLIVGMYVGMIVVIEVLAVILAFFLARGVEIIATLPLLLFLVACFLIAVSLSPRQEKWLGIITAGILTTLSFEQLGWYSLWAIPVTLIGYYRLLDYLILTIISLLPSISIFSHLLDKPLQLLRLLPPESSELIWLPIPNHDRLLISAFRRNATVAILNFQQMQFSPLPGFQHTIKQALPQIVADQLLKVSSISELLLTATAKHPILPLLLPSFYHSQTELEPLKNTADLPSVTSEINQIFPRLQAVAKNVDSALQAEEPTSRKRGLESSLKKLQILQLKLAELGLKPLEIKRWKPGLERWERVIQIEIRRTAKTVN